MSKRSPIKCRRRKLKPLPPFALPAVRAVFPAAESGSKVDSEVLQDGALAMAQAVLQKAINNSGISKSELAVRMGCPEAFVTRMLKGDHNLTVKTLAAALAACGVEVRLDDVVSAVETSIGPKVVDETLLNNVMGVAWINAEVYRPPLHDDGTGSGYSESKKVLLWLRDDGVALGRLTQTGSGDLYWVAAGHIGRLRVTHWAWITAPVPPLCSTEETKGAASDEVRSMGH